MIKKQVKVEICFLFSKWGEKNCYWSQRWIFGLLADEVSVVLLTIF